MFDLLEILSKWRGRRYVSDALHGRGFLIPRSYEAIVKEKCPADERSDVDIYWEEISRELICSAGGAESIRRYVPDRGGYKSKYLDDLYIKESSRGFTTSMNSLHPCERKFLLKKYEDRLFSLEIADRMEALKGPEIVYHNINASMWNGTKAGARNCFGELLETYGYRERGKSFIKYLSSGLMFIVNVDTGGRKQCLSLSFSLCVSSDPDLTKMFHFTLPQIIEGIAYYSIFESAEAAVLGVHAYVEMLDVLANSF